jgi:hypothetical protein
MISPPFSGEWDARPRSNLPSNFQRRNSFAFFASGQPLRKIRRRAALYARAASLKVDIALSRLQPIEATKQGPPMAESAPVLISRESRSYPEVLDEMRRLMPLFRKRVPETNNLRQLPQATCDDIRSSGMARILQPSRYGGSEAPLESMVDVLVPIGSACSATSWCLAQYIIHNYMIARWSKEAQDAIWIEKPDALVSGVLIPLLGKAKRVDGGATLTGRWPFVSGVSGADWCVLSGMMEALDGGPAVESYFLLPTNEVSVLDTWYAIGLKGSASHDVQVKDIFVPEHMIITIKDLMGGDFAGRSTNPGPLFRPPVYMTFGIVLTSAVVGYEWPVGRCHALKVSQQCRIRRAARL